MKPERSATPQIYRDAAKLVEDGIHLHSCVAIYDAAGLGVPAVWSKRRSLMICEQYDELFRPYSNDGWGDSWGICWGLDRQDCRVLALCFMAAITEKP